MLLEQKERESIMNTTSKILTVGVITFILGLSMNNFALSKMPADFKVAVVDVPQIIKSSPQIASLKMEQQKKIEELVAFIENAKTNLNKEPNQAKKKTLEESYNKELNIKKDAIDEEYAKKISIIDKDIISIIKDAAKKADYDLVLTKSSVLDGGIDITNDIVKFLK
jgi:outer membrane protein